MVERDEEGEFLYDPDEQSREASPEPAEQQQGDDGLYARSPSPRPLLRRPEYNYDDEEEEAPKSKSRKRLLKKSLAVEAGSPVDEEHQQDDYETPAVRGKNKDSDEGAIRKKAKKVKDAAVSKKRKSFGSVSSSEKLVRNGKGGFRKGLEWQGSEFSTKKGAKEMKEMWDSVAGNGNDSEVRYFLLCPPPSRTPNFSLRLGPMLPTIDVHNAMD
jgi:hypothetical protein